MDHSKLTVQSDQMFTSVKEKENEKEKEKKSENKKERAKQKTAGRQSKYSRPLIPLLNFITTLFKIPLFLRLLAN